MSRDQLSELLQKCLEGFDNGLAPEECLSAFPEQREQLAPLFRQAVSLRVAYATTPREEYRHLAKERLMFAAGRDVSTALARQPDAEFVQDTRRRLMLAAGASAQEALRSVPPPRLPFWVNARRRLLEAAANPRPRRGFQPVFSTFAMRSALSAAVVVLAIALGGLAYVTQISRPSSVNAQLAELELQLKDVEQQRALGQAVSPTVLIDLTQRTNDLATKLNDQPVTSPLAERLPVLIERQKDVLHDVITQTSSDQAAPPPPELQQAQAQLSQADAKVRLVAARADSHTVTPAPATTGVAGSAETPTVATTPTPATTSPTPAAVTAVSLAGRDILIRPSLLDNTANLSWTEVRSSAIRLIAPSDWKIVGVSANANGLAVLDGDYLGLDGNGIVILINMKTGEIEALAGLQHLILRGENEDGDVMSAEQLTSAVPALAPILQHMLAGFQIVGTLPNATPTAAPSPSPSPAPSATPSPAASPSATPRTSTTPAPTATPRR